MAVVKYAPEEFPLDCLRVVAAKVKVLLEDGVSADDLVAMLSDLEVDECGCMLLAWLFGWIRRQQEQDDEPVFGSPEAEVAAREEVIRVIMLLDGRDPEGPLVVGNLGDYIFAALLKLMLEKVHAWAMEHPVPTWFLEVLEKLLAQLDR